MSKVGKLTNTKDAYASGYLTGLTWKDNWRPGGPWICTALGHSKEEREAESQSRAINEAWLKGFDSGRAKPRIQP